MSKALTPPGEKLEFIFTKSLKNGWVHNAMVRPHYFCARLPAGEEFVLDMILKTGASIPFTATGFLAPDNRFVRYSDIKRADWISENHFMTITPKIKQGLFDRLLITLMDGTLIQLDDLDQAVFPLLKFFRWLDWSKQP